MNEKNSKKKHIHTQHNKKKGKRGVGRREEKNEIKINEKHTYREVDMYIYIYTKRNKR